MWNGIHHSFVQCSAVQCSSIHGQRMGWGWHRIHIPNVYCTVEGIAHYVGMNHNPPTVSTFTFVLETDLGVE